LVPILGLTFETLRALISGLSGFVPKLTSFETGSSLQRKFAGSSIIMQCKDKSTQGGTTNVSDKGSYLQKDQHLSKGEFLTSEGLFFACVQGDGNFCVYRGRDPGDNVYGPALWCTMTQGAGDRFFVMQGDGNLVMYSGNAAVSGKDLWNSGTQGNGNCVAAMQPDGNLCVYHASGGAALWCSMKTDPVHHFEISSIDYDLKGATILSSGQIELYRQTLKNQTSQQQSATVSGQESIVETSGWTDTTSYKIGAETTFKTGIPFIAEGQVKVSADYTMTFAKNASKQTTRQWSFSAPVIVPAKKTIVALVVVKTSAITVPYTMRGTAVLSSGTRLPDRVSKGIYTGTNSHDLNITLIEADTGVVSPAAFDTTHLASVLESPSREDVLLMG
jgi:hypothetical protein